MSGAGGLFPVECQRPVRPAFQERRGSPVFFQTAAQDEDVVFVFFRLIGGDDGHGDGGADDHALKIQIHRGEEIGEHVPHHHVGFRAGDIVVGPPQKGDAAHHQYRQEDPQDVDETPSLMPDEHDVGEAQCQGEDQHDGGREDHEALGGSDDEPDEIRDPELRRIVPEVSVGRQDEHLDEIDEHQNGKSGVVDGVVRIGVVAQLPEKGPEQQYQDRQMIGVVHREEPGRGDGVTGKDHGHPQEHEHREEQDVPHRGLFIQRIESMKHAGRLRTVLVGKLYHGGAVSGNAETVPTASRDLVFRVS